MADESYSDWTVEELRTEASNRDLAGRSGLTKDELVAALEADDASEEAPASEEKEGRPSADEVLNEAVANVKAELELVQADIDSDDRTDPERYEALKEERRLLVDALNHDLTLVPQEEEA